MSFNEIRSLAEDFLVDAKLIQAEEGADVYRKPLDKMVELSKKTDKTELAHMSNSEIFLIFVHLFNGNLYSYYETKEYVEEIKTIINGWTIEKNGKDLMTLVNNMDDQGNLTNHKATLAFMNLNLTSGFFNYNMQSVYECMYCFLKFKQAILNPSPVLAKSTVMQKPKIHKNIYKESFFDRYVSHAEKTIKKDAENHEFRKQVATLRITCLKDLLDRINDETLMLLTEMPDEWHKFLPAELLEPIYDIILKNLSVQYKKLDDKEQEIKKEINATPLASYLYSKKLNPNSLPQQRKEKLDKIENIVKYINFLESLGLDCNDILTTYYDNLINITDEKLLFIEKLISEKALTKEKLRDNLTILGELFNTINTNYEVIKSIIDFSSIFYDDSILLKDLKELKRIITVLSKYDLSKNNYIFLLCNYSYLNIYDLVIENNIPQELFISICKTQNPLNTIKRILIYKSLEEPYQTVNGYLKKDVTAESKFICDDSDLDKYLPNAVEELGLNLIHGTTINNIEKNSIVENLDENYLRFNNLYIIGGVKISRPKFLRNFETVKGNKDYLIASLISDSILSEYSYYKLISELRGKTKK